MKYCQLVAIPTRCERVTPYYFYYCIQVSAILWEKAALVEGKRRKKAAAEIAMHNNNSPTVALAGCILYIHEYRMCSSYRIYLTPT